MIEEMAVRGRRRAGAGLRARGRAQGPPVAADEPGELPERASGCSSRASASRASHRTCRSSSRRRARASARSRRRRRPASASTPRSASPCPRRSRSPRPSSGGWMRFAARGGDATAVDAGLHDHDRPARRLDAGPRRARRDRRPSRRAGLGGDRGVQARVRAVPRARLSGAAAGRGLPAPPALDGAGRRRRRPDHAARLAGAVQRQRDHARGPDRRAGRPGPRRRAARADPRLRAGLRARRPHDRRVRRLRPDGPDAARVHQVLSRPRRRGPRRRAARPGRRARPEPRRPAAPPLPRPPGPASGQVALSRRSRLGGRSPHRHHLPAGEPSWPLPAPVQPDPAREHRAPQPHRPRADGHQLLARRRRGERARHPPPRRHRPRRDRLRHRGRHDART